MVMTRDRRTTTESHYVGIPSSKVVPHTCTSKTQVETRVVVPVQRRRDMFSYSQTVPTMISTDIET